MSQNRLLRLTLSTLVSLLGATQAQAALNATISTDIPAARASFLSQATVLGAYDWSSVFAPGAHSLGSGNPFFSAAGLNFTASDGAVNSIQSVNRVALSLAPGNWIDGPGFNTPNGLLAAADLAVNGAESFDLVFGSPYTSVGLAVATGHSNFPTEVDLLGASFEFKALDASGQTIGSASLVLPAGAPASAWVTLVSTAPIHRLQVRETAGISDNDQYFSNIYATPANVSAVPEPAPALLAGLGLAVLAAHARTRKATGNSLRRPAKSLQGR